MPATEPRPALRSGCPARTPRGCGRAGPYQQHGFRRGESWPRERARGPVGWGGATDGHALTPAYITGGGSTSVVRACVLLRFQSAVGRLEVSEGNQGWGVDKVQAPGFGVPELQGPMPFGRRDRLGRWRWGDLAGRVAECLSRQSHGKRCSLLGSYPGGPSPRADLLRRLESQPFHSRGRPTGPSGLGVKELRLQGLRRHLRAQPLPLQASVSPLVGWAARRPV